MDFRATGGHPRLRGRPGERTVRGVPSPLLLTYRTIYRIIYRVIYLKRYRNA